MNFLYLYLGMLVYLLMDLATFKAGLPKTTSIISAFLDYITLNFYFILGSIAIGTLMVMLLGAGDNTLSFLTKPLFGLGFNLSNSPGSASVLGLLSQWLFIKFRKYFNSIEYLTNSVNEVVTKNQKI